MKKNLLFILSCLFLAPGNIPCAPDTVQKLIAYEHGLDGDQFCNYVYRRYYFVKRLTNTMLLFLDVQDRLEKRGYKPKQLDTLFDFGQNIIFKDTRIQRSIDIMQQKRSLKPLFMIWEDFTGYKSIKDQLFVEEFTKEVFIISRNMLITLAAHDEFVVVPPVRHNATIEHMLNDITNMTCMLYKMHNNESLGGHCLSSTIQRDADLHTFAHIDDVMMRYYIIKRLKDACSLLEKLPYQTQRTILKNNTNWHHPHIISCINIMEQSQSFDPLIELWDEVLQYKYVQDDLFLHEFAQLLLCSFADVFTAHAAGQSSKSQDAITAALELYQFIDTLPLEEILDVIDIITHDLPPLLEKYEFDSDISWQAWLRKYWWTPPLIIGTIIVHILMTWETKNILSHTPDTQAARPTPPSTPKPPTISIYEGEYAWLLENPLQQYF